MPRPVNRVAKRLQILEAAAACFARSGYDATAMDDVATAAAVSKGSLYDYFQNKEDLFYAVFEWFQQQLLDTAAAQLTPAQTATEQIIVALEAAVSGLIQHISLYPVSLEVWAAVSKTGTRERFAQTMRKLYVGYRREVADLIRAAQEAGELKEDADADNLAVVLVGAIDGLVLQYWLDPSFDAHVTVRTFLSSLFDGIAVRRRRR